jgi:hypothetical protein
MQCSTRWWIKLPDSAKAIPRKYSDEILVGGHGKDANKKSKPYASHHGIGFPLRPTSGTTPEEWQFSSLGYADRRYDWCGPEGTTPFEV